MHGKRQHQRIANRFPYPRNDFQSAGWWSSTIAAGRFARGYQPPELETVLASTAVSQCIRIAGMLRILWTLSTDVSGLLELPKYLPILLLKACGFSGYRLLLHGLCETPMPSPAPHGFPRGWAVVTYAHGAACGAVAAAHRSRYLGVSGICIGTR
jgi:hypothetical protein